MLFVAGCDSTPPPLAVADPVSVEHSPGPELSLVGPVTLDERFARMADEMPGFAGLYYDDQGRLTVLAKGEDARSAMRARVPEMLEALGVARGSEAARQAASARVVAARYDFRELYDWYMSRVTPSVWTEGVTMTDIDERRNRIVVGVADGSRMAKISERLARMGIPSDAWEVMVFDPIRAIPGVTVAQGAECDPETSIIECPEDPVPPGWWSLRETVRPVPGGVQITNPSTSGICNVGFNLVRDQPSASRYFVTASHCTIEFGFLDGGSMGQAGPGDVIGMEVLDPPFTSGSPLCPSGMLCRYSDAALFEYNSPADAKGRVAWPPLGSLIWSNTLEVAGVDLHPVLGTEVHKVGRETGRTAGPVIHTCANLGAVEYPGRLLLCQGVVEGSAAVGDSGSPVVRVLSAGSVAAVGTFWGVGELLHGGDLVDIFAFSPIVDVLQDLTEPGGGGLTPVF